MLLETYTCLQIAMMANQVAAMRMGDRPIDEVPRTYPTELVTDAYNMRVIPISLRQERVIDQFRNKWVKRCEKHKQKIK